AELLREPQRMGDRRGSADEVAEEVVELPTEPLLLPKLEPGLGELVESRDQHLGCVPAAVRPEAPPDVGSYGHVHPFTPLATTSFPWISPSIRLAGSFERMSASPTSTADAPARAAATTSARDPMPLSSTATRPGGTRPRRSSAAVTSTSS